MWQRSHWNLTIPLVHVIPCWSNADDCPTHVFLILPDSQLLMSFPSFCPFISASYSLWEAFSNENIMMSVIGEHRISLIMRPWHVAGRSVMALNSRDWQSLTLLFDSPISAWASDTGFIWWTGYQLWLMLENVIVQHASSCTLVPSGTQCTLAHN